ncbi:hypothetical protein [Maritalea porphyrae]|uniref:hypothetical protein n=1 Tax=Maritalea porphyrae TaxID=880732 RepID=UPI0022AFF9A8|nr:hypothetical protein [Maritalea porphyrae]MCZ4270740.1 hypothetical protein [Maritalea porphyrae]
MNNIEIVKKYGFEILPREQFMAKRGPLFDPLIERSIGNKLTRLLYVLFDPSSDEQGWLLWGDDPEELARETVEFMELVA